MVSVHSMLFLSILKHSFFPNDFSMLLPLAYYVDGYKNHIVNYHHLSTQVLPFLYRFFSNHKELIQSIHTDTNSKKLHLKKILLCLEEKNTLYEKKYLKPSINVTFQWVIFGIFMPSTFLRSLPSVCGSASRAPDLDTVPTLCYWQCSEPN